MNRHRGNTVTALLAMLPVWIVAFASIVAFSECRDRNSDVATPRRVGYPRIALCDTVYIPAGIKPLDIEVNTCATVSEKTSDSGTQWIDIAYPAYNATIYCTITHAHGDAIREAIANRKERFGLNIGNNQFEATEIDCGNGITGEILATRHNTVTPLMFIATDNSNWIISGTFAFDSNTKSNYDSVAPIINAVHRDIVHTITHIGPHGM